MTISDRVLSTMSPQLGLFLNRHLEFIQRLLKVI